MSTLASRQRHGHDSVSPGLGLQGSEEGSAAARLHRCVPPDCHINQPGLYDANKFASNIWFGAWGGRMI